MNKKINTKTILACSLLLSSLLNSKANGWFFDDMERQMQQMEKRMAHMRQNMMDMFKDVDESHAKDFGHAQAATSIDQIDDNAVITIALGAGVKNFDAKITPHALRPFETQGRSAQDGKIFITAENGNKQEIVINVVGNSVSVRSSTEVTHEKQMVQESEAQEEKVTSKEIDNTAPASAEDTDTKEIDNTDSIVGKDSEDSKTKEPKIQSYQASYFASSSSIGKTMNKKLDVSKATIEYDEKTGVLSIVIPHAIEEENLGKNIDVIIKK